MKKKIDVIFNLIGVSFLVLALVNACQSTTGFTQTGNPEKALLTDKDTSQVSKPASKYLIKGMAKFPESKFKTKASVTDIANTSTISLIYPPDHPTQANKTITSGTSNGLGAFTINENYFIPKTNEIYVLEATKRIGGNEKNVISIQTYLKWNGNSWDSITTPGIYINENTTALAIIAGHNPTTITASDLIGKINVSTGVISTIGNVSSQTVSNVAALVNTVLGTEKDPFVEIKYDHTNYFIDRSDILGQLIQTSSCLQCDFSSRNLTDVNISYSNIPGVILTNAVLVNTVMTGSNLTSANLSGANLNNTNLAGTILTNANLSNTVSSNYLNLSHTDLTTVNLSGTDLSTADLSGANFTGKNLTGRNLTETLLYHTNFKNANLTNVIFTGNDLSSTIFTGSNLSGANLSDCDLSNTLLFDISVLSGANLTNANLTGSIIKGLDLSNLNLTGANLYYTDVTGANFSGATLSGATWIDGTVFASPKVCAANSVLGQCN